MSDVQAVPRPGSPAGAAGLGGRVAVPARESRAAEALAGYSELLRTIQEAGLMRRRLGYYWARLAAALVALAGIWVAFAVLGNSWWQLLLAAALAIVLTQFGFLGHDTSHRQFFSSHRCNEWGARLISGLIGGLSYGWWMSKHTRHHGAPNQEGRDPDIGPGFVSFTPAVVAGKRGFAARAVRHQGYWFFPLLLLEGASLHVASVRALTSSRRLPLRHRWLDLSLLSVRLLGYLVVLFGYLPPGKAAAFLGVQLGLFGLLLGASFAPNHTGRPIVPATAKVDFVRRQVLMSRNVRGGIVVDFLMGGLNFQIEHHLFPSMARPNLRLAQPYVREFCARRGIAYTEATLMGSYRGVIRYLNQVGRHSDVFACPLLTQYHA